MSRQDANAAFALSSFLQGTNATYIDDLYARYEQDPASVDAEWQEFFKSLKDTPADVQKNAEGPSWGRDNWPLTPRDELTSALDGNWAAVEKAVGAKIAAKAQAKGAELSAADVNQATRDSVRALMLIRAYRMRGHFHAKLDPLGIEAQRDREELDPRTYGFTEADFDRKIFLDHVLGLEYGTLREIVAICERTYCQTLGVEFMHITNAGAEGLDPGAHRGSGQGNQLHPRGTPRDPQQADRGRRLREILRPQVHRHQALRPRRRRIADPGAGADHQARRQSRREGNRARHAASRPPQRADPGDGQAAPRAVPRIQGRLRQPGRGRRLRRRQVPSRRLVRPRVRRQPDPSVADRQPVASRNRRSRRARQGARQAGPARRSAGHAHFGAADADAWRRGVRRPGRGGRMLRAVRPEGLPHRRLAAFHRQQPDRLHHLSALFALLALSVRRGEDDRRADLPRERRRSGSGGVRGQGRDRVPAEIPQACRHRHVLLSPPRPQRGRRAGVHPAGDVQEDRDASRHGRDLFQAADRRRRDDRGRGREGQGRLARAARCRARGRLRLQAQQGRLARRQVGRLQVRRPGRRRPPRRHRRRHQRPQGYRPQDHQGAGRFPGSPHHPALPGKPRARRSTTASASTGRPARRWRSARCCRKAITSACRARTASAAPSRSAIRC